MARILYIDPRLPSELDDVATGATSADWTVIQKSGETALRRINPIDAVPDLPAAKIATGIIDQARLPDMSIGTSEIEAGAISTSDEAYTSSESSLSGSFSEYQSISITTPSAGTLVVTASVRLSHQWSGTVTTSSFISWQLRRGTTALWTQDAIGMAPPGAAGVFAIGGTISGTHIQSCAAGLTYSFNLRLRNYTSSGSGTLSSKVSERRIGILYLKR